jgi:hypothetical protein
MTTIYIVTEGKYSGKENIAAYTNYEDAVILRDLLSAKGTYMQARIEELSLDEPFDMSIYEKPLETWWHIVFKSDSADIIHISEQKWGGPAIIGTYSDGGIYVEVRAETKEHAAKIAMERRSVWLADQTKGIS